MKTALLFDMDMTLINSRPGMFEAMRNVLSRYIGEKPDVRSFFDTPGMTERVLAEKILSHYGKVYEEKMSGEIFEEIARVAKEFVRPFDGAYELLKELKQRNLKLALCTNTSMKKAVCNFEACGMPLSIFDAIVTGEDIQKGKPDPEIFLKGAMLLSEKPEDCVVVEDAKIGLLGAKRAGMTSIATTGSFEAKEIKNDADFVCEKLLDILEIINTLNKGE